MKYTILFLATFLCTASSFAQGDHPLQGYQEAKGDVVARVKYQLPNDPHVLFLTQTGYYQSVPDKNFPDEICMNKEIYAFDFGKDNSVPPLLSYKMYDFIHDCETSARLEFSKEVPILTDLDHDGRPEIWIAYFKGCHGDVSPDELKVFMYKDGKKHAIRGENRIFVDGQYLGGGYKMDNVMKRANKVFSEYGVKLFNHLAESNQ